MGDARAIPGQSLCRGKIKEPALAEGQGGQGARPLKRTLQREVETPAAMEVLRGGFGPGAALHVDVATGGAEDGGLKVWIE